jgi:hypothetical protein
VIRQRGGATRRRDEQQEATISSAEEIGHQLRDARVERGLDLLAVHDRLSRPITLLEALEQGDLARLPDQALALSTVRRYAAFLGLDGDALALRMIDAWSTWAPPSNGAQRTPGSESGSAATNVVAAVTPAPDHLRAFTQTGPVPRVGGGSTAALAGYELTTGPPTGTFPVVPRHEIKDSKRAVARARRRLRAPTPLKVFTWVAAALVLVALAGFGVRQWRPQWLVRSHVIRIAQPGGAPAATPPPTSGTHRTPLPPVQLTSTTGQVSTYSVRAQRFTVDIATSGQVWVQVTSADSPVPLISGVQAAGKALTFPAKTATTVEVGASAVVVAVRIGTKAVFSDQPKATPYTYVFNPAG